MRQIPLTRGKFALVDNEDYAELSKHKWYALKDRHIFYAVRMVGKKMVRIHRQIMDAQKGQEVDHRNGEGLDNRRSNLRFCTHSQNLQNQHTTGGTSRYKGVSWQKREKIWRAKIKINGHTKHLGHFINEDKAGKAYDIAAVKLFGEFARLNNPLF